MATENQETKGKKKSFWSFLSRKEEPEEKNPQENFAPNVTPPVAEEGISGSTSLETDVSKETNLGDSNEVLSKAEPIEESIPTEQYAEQLSQPEPVTSKQEQIKNRWAMLKTKRGPEDPTPKPVTQAQKPIQPAQTFAAEETEPNSIKLDKLRDENIEFSSRADETYFTDQESFGAKDQEDHAVIQQAIKENSLNLMNYWGVFLVFFFLILQIIPDAYMAYKGQALFCPAEGNYINTFLQTAASGQWLVPITTTSGQWPGFTWLTLGIAHFLGTPDWLYPLISLISALIATAGVWFLGRTAYGFGSATAAGLVLLSSALFVPLIHFFGPAALAAGLEMFALVFLSYGFRGNANWISLPLGFIFTALAGLTGGFYYILLPIISTLIFLIWCHRYRRAQRGDAIFGFLCLLAIWGAYLAYILTVTKNTGYLQQLFQGAFRKPWPIDFWWLPFALIILGLFPWILGFIFPSWIKIIVTAWGNLKASRNEQAASAYLWITLAVGLVMVLFLPPSQYHMAAVTLVCLASVLVGKTLMRLSKAGTRLFLLCCSLIFLGLGCAIIACYFPAVQGELLPYIPKGIFLDVFKTLAPMKPVLGCGILLAVASIYILKCFWSPADAGRMLITTACVAWLLSLPITLLVAPVLANQPYANLKSLAQIKAMPKASQAAKPQVKETPKPAPAVAPQPAAAPATQPAPKAPEAKPAATPAPAPAAAPEVKAAQPAPKAPEAKPAAPEVKVTPPAPQAPAAKPEEAKPAATPAPAPAAAPTEVKAAQPAPKAPEAKSEAAKPAATPAPAPTEVKATQPAPKAPEAAKPAAAPQPAAKPEAKPAPAPAAAPTEVKAAQPAPKAPEAKPEAATPDANSVAKDAKAKVEQAKEAAQDAAAKIVQPK
ncbi:MAG: hypothetical protein IJT59_01300 [Desulfovibrionaceae bacterium]|nr:hypothetical protein [Desulfovibrionaceae bacterium]